MSRYVCIHGHFYQPPRENPWLEAVELQDSASPYHDWNARVTAECYSPNATTRILDGDGKIIDIVNNYSKISFNFGPTLLTWLKDKRTDVHDAIVEADRLSQQRFSGHGSAMAQAFNHMILPLANERDRHTQVLWGIRDFESRFGRKPEGMWLAETAADVATLETLAEQGIQFTVLSPYQAAQLRKIGDESWEDVSGAKIDPSRAYLCRLPSGREISLFFYDAPVSQAVAFERLLSSGERLSDRLTGAFSDGRDWPQLVHIATDGESYGHHHKHGEMALAYALRNLELNEGVHLTNYGEFLEKFPPTHEVQIHEKSAWSCSHGVGRWERDCGCNTGGRAGWNQSWRGPLREALDWLRDKVTPLYEQRGAELLKDPWTARDEYIGVILNRSRESLTAFLTSNALDMLDAPGSRTVLELMEMQRHAMLMYTSCGWFFDELSGIETVQVIQYAGRVIQLAREVFGEDLEAEFLKRLAKARSNIREHGDGAAIYNKFVKPAMIDPEKLVAHYAISSIFHEYGGSTRLFLYSFEQIDREMLVAGKARLTIGRVKVTFEITHESWILAYAMLYMGEHHLTGAVEPFETNDDYLNAANAVRDPFERADFAETIRQIDRHFGPESYSLKSLFKDEQRRILDQILASTRDDLENRYRLITERYTPLMRFLQDLGTPLPAALQTASDFILQKDLSNVFGSELVDIERLEYLLQQARPRQDYFLDADFSFDVTTRMEAMILSLRSAAMNLPLLVNLENVARVMVPMQIGLNLGRTQNLYWEMLEQVFPDIQAAAASSEEGADARAAEWCEHFIGLGKHLEFAVESIVQTLEQRRHAA